MVQTVTRENIVDYIGYQAEPSEWFTIDQTRINDFADCTLDHQFIHVDPASASKTPFGSTIAHGFLTLSLCVHLISQQVILMKGVYMGVNYGLDKLRFLSPVKVDSRVRTQYKVLDIAEKSPGKFLTRVEITVEIEGEEKPALVAEWLTMQMVS